MKYRVVVEEEVVVSWEYDVDASDPDDARAKVRSGMVPAKLGGVYGSDGSEGSGPVWDYSEVYELEDSNV